MHKNKKNNIKTNKNKKTKKLQSTHLKKEKAIQIQY